MKEYIREYKNAMSRDTCNQIINWMETCDLQPGKVGNGIVNTQLKESLDLYLDITKNNSINQVVAKSILKSIGFYKKEFPELEKLGKWNFCVNYNAQKYLPGKGYYDSHCESCSISNSQRVLAWMIYLNTIKDGGGTRFPLLKKDIDPECGKCVIWPAGWTHMHHGIVSKDESKYILTGWFVFE